MFNYLTIRIDIRLSNDFPFPQVERAISRKQKTGKMDYLSFDY